MFMSADKKTFRFVNSSSTREVSIYSKELLHVEKLLDRKDIKSYLIRSHTHKYAIVQCTKRYFIVLYLEQECGYVEDKRTRYTELFEFSCLGSDLDFFKLKKYKSTNYSYDYENEDRNNENILMYRDGIFYINKKGYVHNEKERS